MESWRHQLAVRSRQSGVIEVEIQFSSGEIGTYELEIPPAARSGSTGSCAKCPSATRSPVRRTRTRRFWSGASATICWRARRTRDLAKPPFDKPQSFLKLFHTAKQKKLVETVKAVKENAEKIVG